MGMRDFKETKNNFSTVAQINYKEVPDMIKLKNGSIRKRNGKYEIRFYYNKKRYSVYAATQKEVVKKQEEKLRELKKGIDTQFTVGQWIDKWLILYKENKIADTSYKNLLNYKNKWCKSILDINIKRIDSFTIQKLLNDISLLRTREGVYSMLNDSIKTAYNTRLIEFNPMNAVELSKKGYRKKINSLNEEQQTMLLKAINGSIYEVPFKLALYSGARRSELTNLKWEDIDYKKGLLHIKGTKTSNANRYLPISNKLKEVLELIPKEQKKLVTVGEHSLTNKMVKLIKEFKWENITFHSLRHTFASNCVNAGIKMKVLQMWLGHANFKMTADRYTHIEEKYSIEEVSKLNK